jgi:hypothetical protein
VDAFRDGVAACARDSVTISSFSRQRISRIE